MVGIVVVSHSQEVAVGACELALQMAGGEAVSIVPAGGADDGSLGTSIDKVARALDQVLEQGDALVLADLGSAVMVTQMAIEMLPPEIQGRIQLTDAPLVEGAIAAVVAAAGGENLDAVRRAAERALETSKIPSDAPLEEEASPPPSDEVEEGPVESVEVIVPNPTGLHARPAARFVRQAMAFDAQVTVQNVTHNRSPANAKSMLDVASQGTAWQGERIRIVAKGKDAAEAVLALRKLVEGGFGEMEEEEAADFETVEEVSAAVKEKKAVSEGQLQGIPASEGIAVAPLFLYTPSTLEIERQTVSDPVAEVARLHEALQQAQEELSTLQAEVAEQDEDVARIFEFQRMMLEDRALVDSIEDEIHRATCNAEVALEKAISEWKARFERTEDELMRLRAADVQDVGNRVLRILLGIEEEEGPLSTLAEPVIVGAQDLNPSDTARLDRGKVRGLCTAMGGATSHVAILARMWSLPAVVGLGDSLLRVPEETLVAIDGEAGILEIDPPPAVVESYQEQQERRAALVAEALRHVEEPAVTSDGHRVEVVANVGDVASAQEALKRGAEGVGLLRTEFLYLDRGTLPDEEEQVEVYSAIAQVMGQRPVIVRTLDVGGDKPLPAIPRPKEMNPALGVRAIRLSRSHPQVLLTQLRAILRAGVGHNLKVMFPLVATVGELRWVKDLLRQAREELATEGLAYAEEFEVGIMVETPAAALVTDALAGEVDFFSIGTNDLTQYTLACDRGNEQLGYLYHSLDPAVLRLIARVVEVAHAAGRWVGVCGEMAGHRLAIPMLLGLGVDEFSMTPNAIPLAKQLIRSLSMAEAREIAEHVPSLPTTSEVEGYLNSVLEALG